jgi:3-phosphoinositide dependent protein kinase-1
MRATHIASGQEYAIKVLDKGHLIRHQKMSTALAEKNALVKLGAGHPGIVRLSWTFHDEWSLCESYRIHFPRINTRVPNVRMVTDFVLDLARNGEMQTRISQLGSLSTECTRYYAAQIVDAVDFMHSKGVIHRFAFSRMLCSVVASNCVLHGQRDLKPENLLLDDAYRIRITDFGTGKILDSDSACSLSYAPSHSLSFPKLRSQRTGRKHSLVPLNTFLQNCLKLPRQARGKPC